MGGSVIVQVIRRSWRTQESRTWVLYANQGTIMKKDRIKNHFIANRRGQRTGWNRCDRRWRLKTISIQVEEENEAEGENEEEAEVENKEENETKKKKTEVIEYKDRNNCTYVYFAGVSYATIHEMIYMISDAYRITGVCWNIFSSVTESLCCLAIQLWRISKRTHCHTIMSIQFSSESSMGRYCLVWPNTVYYLGRYTQSCMQDWILHRIKSVLYCTLEI